MPEPDGGAAVPSADLTDEQIVERVLRGDDALFEIIMRRYNQRLYRAARGILRDPGLAEDAIQQGYVNAYFHLNQFAGRSRFSTWLTRIVVHEALARARREATQTAAISSVPDTLVDRHRSPLPDPERQALTGELSALIEAAVDALPQGYRAVVILREIEGLTTAETAACLSVGTDVVKTRLSRARSLLRASLNAPIGASAAAAFHFHASRCDRVVVAVFWALTDRRTTY